MRIQAAAITRRGTDRPINQDAVAMAGWLSQAAQSPAATVEADAGHGQIVACVVADGLGGHPSGEIASFLAARDITANAYAMTGPQEVAKALRSVSTAIRSTGARDRTTIGMRTTVAGLVIGIDHVLGFSVGDSSLFDVVDGLLFPISAADRPPDPGDGGTEPRGRVSQCLGSSHDIDPHVWKLLTGEPRRYVLCTDGITNYADRAGLERCLASGPDPGHAATALLATAVAGGTVDDATVMVVDVFPASGGPDDRET